MQEIRAATKRSSSFMKILDEDLVERIEILGGVR